MLALAIAACVPFTAVAKTPVAGTVIAAQAYVEYQTFGIAQVERASSNRVVANVLGVESLVLTAPQSVNRPPNVTATLGHLLTNTGNLTSSYSVSLVAGGAGCPATSFNLSALRLVRDINGNGVADAADPVLPLGTAGAFQLAPGESASLLVQGLTPNISNGTSCVVLTATTAVQVQTASNVDVFAHEHEAPSPVALPSFLVWSFWSVLAPGAPSETELPPHAATTANEKSATEVRKIERMTVAPG